VLTVVGARPHFIKAAQVTRALRNEGVEEVLVHTGQHYDFEMSQRFFDELALPAPKHHLGIGSGPHGRQTGGMLASLEPVMMSEQPSLVVVYGDTNSTLAGALCAAKLQLPIAHVEAGLRSFNRRMPEEINRIVTDRLSRSLFCPSERAVDNLRQEGIVAGVAVVGDVLCGALHQALSLCRSSRGLLDELALEDRSYLLATLHRPENVDDAGRLTRLLHALSVLGERVILPLHPRTRDALEESGLSFGPSVTTIAPVGYVDMVRLERSARLVLTDSGGVQREAYWLGVPCLTLRDETEWEETVESGWNLLVGAEPAAIERAVATFAPAGERPPFYGDEGASGRIARLIARSAT
jgi:UDP-N-acetylglucosamine 2-epimerase